jgi:hypothetical protein
MCPGGLTNYETVIGIAEIAPNANVRRHTHPGPESGYELCAGDVELLQRRPLDGLWLLRERRRLCHVE